MPVTKYIPLLMWWVSILLIPIFLCINSCRPKKERETVTVPKLEGLRDSMLGSYSFSRTDFDPEKLELLAGNGEMGGLVRADGLGFDFIWCSDLWANKEFRIPLEGVKASFENAELAQDGIVHYSQKQSLQNGIVDTQVQLKNGVYYGSEVFFSADSKRMLLLKIKNYSKNRELQGKLHLPKSKFMYASSWPEYTIGTSNTDMFNLRRINNYEIKGKSVDSLFTQGAWYLKSNLPLSKTNESNVFEMEIAPGAEQCFYFSYITDWQTSDFSDIVQNSMEDLSNFNRVRTKHVNQWAVDWAITPYLELPDKRHEELFYRSAFWLFCTSGSEQFLPGESQFANGCWNMKPFTYGAAGWSTLAFMHLGHFEKAKKMLMNHYKPKGLRKNADLYITGGNESDLAFSFAHEAQTDGTTTGTCDEQRHVNGFALALFHKYYIMTEDTEFLHQYLYPVAKGVAEFWSDLAVWDNTIKAYTFPVLRSVSEDLFEKSLLDIVLSAKWSLDTAVYYAELLKKDEPLSSKWSKVSKNMHIPQNKRYYLEFLGDTEERDYASYQGIRAPVYLGYPTSELGKDLNREKAMNTLEHAWMRNHSGNGMLGFIASWYALAAQNYGLGNLALEMADQNFNCYDPSHTALSEGPENRDRHYFLTTTSAYLLFPLNMVVNSRGNDIVPFPAVPEDWTNLVFHQVPAKGGRHVSGTLKNGEVQYFRVEKNKKVMHQTVRRDTIRLN
ncbi:MAG: hypothetical protein AAFX53_06205 [Bacteroidota bacterium]